MLFQRLDAGLISEAEPCPHCGCFECLFGLEPDDRFQNTGQLRPRDDDLDGFFDGFGLIGTQGQ